MAKIESRLEANPQCKEVLNAKTGTLMPCLGPEKIAHSQANGLSTSPSSVVAPACKPQTNTKTGSVIPCPND